MKNTLKFYRWSIVLLLFGATTALANGFSHMTEFGHGPAGIIGDSPTETVQSAPTTTTKDNLVGGWSYTVQGAPAGYEKGLLMIVKEGDNYKVQVQIGSGTIQGDNVKVNGNTIDFEVMVEGGMVSVNLTAKGDTISGKSTSPEGSYTITGEKTLSMG